MVRTGIVFRWLGLIAALGGLLYMAPGVAVGYSGLTQPGGLIRVLFLVFAVGVLVAGLRRKEPAGTAGG